MKVIFAGTPIFAERHLEALISSEHDICAVYTQPDRPAGRGKKLMASPVKQLALRHDLPVFQPQSLKREDAQLELSSLDADIMVVVAYGLILPEAILKAPRLGCVNVHGSILPRWRGAAPIQRAIQAGDMETGVTIMQMDAGLDTGDMLLKATCAIESTDTSASLHDRLAELGPAALLNALDLLNTGRCMPQAQDDKLANYAAKIEKVEAKLDWQKTAIELDREIRAFNPFPISYAEIEGERIKIHQARPVDALDGLRPGKLLLKDGKIFVGCAEGALELEFIQLPGKRAMRVSDYLNGTGQTLPADAFDL